MKLKDCQNIQKQSYQHRRDYVEGDKVWFQPLNGNAWIGPALVVTQRGQSVYLHAHGEIDNPIKHFTQPLRQIFQRSFWCRARTAFRGVRCRS